jgi:hypothetical protein
VDTTSSHQEPGEELEDVDVVGAPGVSSSPSFRSVLSYVPASASLGSGLKFYVPSGEVRKEPLGLSCASSTSSSPFFSFFCSKSVGFTTFRTVGGSSPPG